MEDISRNNVNRNFDGTSMGSNFSVNNDYTDRQSWNVIFDRLSSDMRRLYEKESLLIRTEFKEKMSEFKTGVVSLVIAGSLLMVGGLAAVATGIILLDLVMPLWASALIVTSALLIVGGVLVGGAKKKLNSDVLRPHQSIETISEIKSTFKERINEFKLRQHH